MENILDGGGFISRPLLLENSKNSTNGNIHINVGRPIKRIKSNTVLGIRVLRDGDFFFVLLGNHQRDNSGTTEKFDHGVVGEDIELFDGFSLDVDGTFFSLEVHDTVGGEVRRGGGKGGKEGKKNKKQKQKKIKQKKKKIKTNPAARTLELINLEALSIAFIRIANSPVASGKWLLVVLKMK